MVKTSVRRILSHEAIFAPDVVVARFALCSSFVGTFLALFSLLFHASHVAQPFAVLALATTAATANHQSEQNGADDHADGNDCAL